MHFLSVPLLDFHERVIAKVLVQLESKNSTCLNMDMMGRIRTKVQDVMGILVSKQAHWTRLCVRSSGYFWINQNNIQALNQESLCSFYSISSKRVKSPKVSI